MAPRTRWTYREIEEDGTKLEVVVTVSSETRRIANGVLARVVRDTVTEDGHLVEDTFDWYAQDEKGNIWYLGEDTAEFEGGKSRPGRDRSKPESTALYPGSSSPPTRPTE
jgi:hypothetical protein